MASKKKDSLTLVFNKERETRNTWRYHEDGPDDKLIIKSLYLQKTTVEELGSPDTLAVTIEPA